MFSWILITKHWELTLNGTSFRTELGAAISFLSTRFEWSWNEMAIVHGCVWNNIIQHLHHCALDNIIQHWLVVYTPLKIWKPMGRIIPYIMENKKWSKPPTSHTTSISPFDPHLCSWLSCGSSWFLRQPCLILRGCCQFNPIHATVYRWQLHWHSWYSPEIPGVFT